MTALGSNLLDHRTSRPVAARFVGRVVAVGAVVAVTLLGNLRLQASEIVRTPSVGAAKAASASQPARTEVVRVRDDESRNDDEADALQLVPAIYAWDPAVRYVYFRHVSKWM